MSIIGLGFIWNLARLALFLAPVAAMIHTHDMTVRAYPNLGRPIFFKN